MKRKYSIITYDEAKKAFASGTDPSQTAKQLPNRSLKPAPPPPESHWTRSPSKPIKGEKKGKMKEEKKLCKKRRRKKEMPESVPGIPRDPLNRPVPGFLHRRRALVKG
ncbi:2544_t:CDS:2 [Paraglomus occultum]|uniref:2544_t:CDS:1 n=1 Tax=Paraglomus occultum TaxID=144539 RepID=A0A9N9AYL8_9GLOM|nr:2544_t:CDS:2 [Paraglomus occultum]